MTSRDGTAGRPRLRRHRTAVAGAVLMTLSACGLPGDGEVQTVRDDSVPYRLLDVDHSGGAAPEDDPVPRSAPVVFWLRGSDILVPAATRGSCADPHEELVERLLAELAAGPAEDVRAAGRSSALPPGTDLQLVEVGDGTAQVEVAPGAAIGADRLPLAVGQLVLTLTSTPGVRRVVLLSSGEAVQVPLPGGALTTRPVSADDYAPLVADRFRSASGPSATPSTDLGCRPRTP